MITLKSLKLTLVLGLTLYTNTCLGFFINGGSTQPIRKRASPRTSISIYSISSSLLEELAKSRRKIQNLPLITYRQRYISSSHDRHDHVTILQQSNTQNDENDIIDMKNEKEVPLGSKDYYSGFISRGLNEEPEERVTGDAVLVPTLKFVGGFAAILVVLFGAFLVSNGLI